MDEMTIFTVWATWRDNRGEMKTRSTRLFTELEEAIGWYHILHNSLASAQENGLVKHFTMHLQEQHLEK